jgi:hypothetical protein
MNRYLIKLRKPSSNHFIWAGPNYNSGTIPTPEDDKAKTRREALANRLEKLVNGRETRWDPRNYCYEVELTEEEVTEIKTWPGVRHVIKR